MQFATIGKIAGAEKAGPKPQVREHPFRKTLSNRTLATTCMSIEPIYTQSIVVVCPIFDKLENLNPRSFKAVSVMFGKMASISGAW